MDAVTTKPVTLARLRSAIAEGCNAAKKHVAPPGEETSTPRLRELADMLGEEAVAEITRTFADDTQVNLAALRAAASRGDRHMIGRIAHSLAGAGRNVGADALAARASGLEDTVGDAERGTDCRGDRGDAGQPGRIARSFRDRAAGGQSDC